MTALAISAGAVSGIPTAAQDLALEARSRWADSYFSAHYPVPLETYGGDVKIAVAQLAAFDLLMGRGIDPDSETYKIVSARAERAQKWLEGVSEQRIIPSMLSADAQAIDSAIVYSQPSRGWRDDYYVRDGGEYDDFWDPCG